MKGDDQVSGVATVATFTEGQTAGAGALSLEQGGAGQSVSRSCGRGRRRDGPSGRAPFVPMVDTTDLRDRHDGAVTRRHDRTGNRRVFVQRQVKYEQ